jgi:hypothetical protein
LWVVNGDWDVLWTMMKGSHMCDMEGVVVGQCHPKQVSDRARWGYLDSHIFNISQVLCLSIKQIQKYWLICFNSRG